MLPELAPADLTPELLRAGILRDGCVLVRGLVERERALRFARADRPLVRRARAGDPGGGAPRPATTRSSRRTRRSSPRRGATGSRQGGGVLAVDAPLLSCRDDRAVRGRRRAGGSSRATSASPAVISLRRRRCARPTPAVGGRLAPGRRVHGRGALAQPVAVALALRRRGARASTSSRAASTTLVDDADRRGACSTTRSRSRKAEEAAGDRPIVRPIFEPGDALLFDELFLHQTGSDPSMPNPRFAIESWFFGASGLPARVRAAGGLTLTRAAAATGSLPERPDRWGTRWRSPPSSCCRASTPRASRSVVEVGAYAGDLTRVLLDWAAEAGARVTAVDPAPQERLRGARARAARARADPRDQPRGAAADRAARRVIIDGDHNYFTVSEELRLIASARAGRRAAAAAVPRRRAGRTGAATTTSRPS